MTQKNRSILILLCVILAALAVAGAVLVRHSNKILTYLVRKSLGEHVTVQSVDVSWGNMKASGIRMTRGAEPVLDVAEVRAEADFIGLLKKNYAISRLTVTAPFLRIGTDRNGKLLPLVPDQKAEKPGDQPHAPDEKPVDFGRISIRQGKLLFRDGKAGGHQTTLDNIEAEIRGYSFPHRNDWTTIDVTAGIPGRTEGRLTWKGKTNLTNSDAEGKVTIRNLDITTMKPYFQKKGDADVSRGTLDLDMDLVIRSRHVRGPGKVTIRDLAFREGSGAGDTFVGVPRSLVIGLLTTEQNAIVLHFTVEGDIDNPRFSIRENLVKQVTIGLAKRLGLSFVEAGGSIVIEGVKGVGQTGKGLSEIGNAIRNLFRK